MQKQPITLPHKTVAQTFMLLGGGIFALSVALALAGKSPLSTWFYPLAWWSGIVALDGWVYRHRGESLLISFPARFLFLALWSVALWSIYELFNFRLGNWHYTGLPQGALLRWVGYAVSFATVVPALLETADLLDSAKGPSLSVPPRARSGRSVMIGMGTASVVLPVLWPTWFYPLVWGALFFLLDPLNDRWGRPSILSDWRSGSCRRLVLLLAAGLVCGLLWESLNMGASARWVYTIPGMERGKIFEMPVLGYVGFMPFAVSAYAATVAATWAWEKMGVGVRVTAVACATALTAAIFAGIDRFAVLRP